MPTIIQASKRILNDPLASANEALIDFAARKGVFTEKDKRFYRDIWRKRTLSPKQISYKRSLNRRLLYRLILSARGAYQRLKNDLNGSAGPKLIDYAFMKEILTERDREFYQNIWDRSTLTDGQARYKYVLNRRIIEQLKTDLDSDYPRQITDDERFFNYL